MRTVTSPVPAPVAAGPSVETLIQRRHAAGGPAPFVDGTTGRTLSWAEVVGQVSSWQRRRGALVPWSGASVGLHVADPLDMISSFLCGLATGVMLAPLAPDATADELTTQCIRLGVATIVTDTADGDLLDTLAAQGVSCWRAGRGGPSARRLRQSTAPLPCPDDTALVMASSGTTGTPKIVPLAEGQLLAVAANIARHHRLGPDDRGYCPLPLFHINALVVGVLSTLVAGSRLIVDRRFSRRRFWATVAEHQATWLNIVPAIITALADGGDDGPVGPGRIRFARSASAPLAPVVRARFEQRFDIPVLETYGMTEAASQITASPPAGRDGTGRAGSVGRPVGVELRVVDRAGRPVAPGVIGDVQIRGDNVTPCYWPGSGGAPVAAVGGDGWLDTGDVGHLDEDGFVFLAGRADDVINRGGEKIHPLEVEEVLLADPRVVAAVVVGRPHPTVGAEPIAYVLASVDPDGRDALVADLTRRCAASLSRYKRPVEITLADTLPRGPTGKVRRSALRALAAAGPDPRAATAPARPHCG